MSASRYAVTVGAQFVGGVHAPLPLREPDLVAARKLGAALVEAVAGKKVWPEQVRAIGEQRERFGRIIAFHKDKWPYEHQYWQNNGWL